MIPGSKVEIEAGRPLSEPSPTSALSSLHEIAAGALLGSGESNETRTPSTRPWHLPASSAQHPIAGKDADFAVMPELAPA